jgi:hypothetical protein
MKPNYHVFVEDEPFSLREDHVMESFLEFIELLKMYSELLL